ncbi:MAG TPA: lanthionine synthetase C family protein, partial [Xanthomonadaceae bacterium]|nr:lanthionine synthetase C family protein [Xanthomonadaceae bacterium]
AWCLQRVAPVLWPTELAECDFTSEVDGILEERLGASDARCYDLVSGSVGHGMYAIEHPTTELRELFLDRVLDRLLQNSSDCEHGTTWFTQPDVMPEYQRQQYPKGYHNLGLAHGIPGIVAMLARAVRKRSHADRAMQLLDRTMTWLLLQRQPQGASDFPWVAEAHGTSSRMAWCYGDPGVAVAMVAAAQAANRSDWLHAGMQTALKCARRTVQSSGIQDTGLCHGSAGLALIFQRLSAATGSPQLAEAADFWMTYTIEQLRPANEHAGVTCFHLDEGNSEPYYRTNCTLLNGSAGVGLALLSQVYDVAMDWDVPMLTSLAA